jgi:hypothetical protein
MATSRPVTAGLVRPQIAASIQARLVDLWHAHRLAILLSGGLFAWLTLLGALQPLTPDEAVYKIVSTGMLHGQWPYRDLFDHKPPLAYVWYLPMALGGNIELQRALAAVFLAASIPVFSAIARRWIDGRAHTLATVSFALMLANPGLSVRANLESFVLLPLVASMAVPSPLAAGALLGVAAMTKPMALLFAPMLWLRWRRDAWKAAVALLGTCAVVSAPFLPIWHDFVTANVWFNLDYGHTSGADRLDTLLTMPAPVFIGSLPFWGAAVVGAVRCRDARPWLFLACGLASTKLSGQQFNHYYVLLLPAAALFAGLGLDWAWNHRAGRSVVALAAVAAVLPTCVGFVPLIRDYASIHHPFGEARATIDATPGEFYLLGDHSQPYLHADRMPERRFFFDVPLVVRPEWGEQVRQDLLACPPAVLVTAEDRLFHVAWQDDVTSLYGRRIVTDGGTVYLDPIRHC